MGEILETLANINRISDIWKNNHLKLDSTKHNTSGCTIKNRVGPCKIRKESEQPEKLPNENKNNEQHNGTDNKTNSRRNPEQVSNEMDISLVRAAAIAGNASYLTDASAENRQNVSTYIGYPEFVVDNAEIRTEVICMLEQRKIDTATLSDRELCGIVEAFIKKKRAAFYDQYIEY